MHVNTQSNRKPSESYIIFCTILHVVFFMHTKIQIMRIKVVKLNI